MAEQEATPVEGDVTSVSSKTSTYEEACPCPMPESLDHPECERQSGKFPARNVSDGKTSARTCLPWFAFKKSHVATASSKESGERTLKDRKMEVRMEVFFQLAG